MFILIAVGIAALFFSMQRKPWFVSFSFIVFVSAVVIITSIIQIQIMSALAFLMLFGVMWIGHVSRRSETKTRSRLISFFCSGQNDEIETDLTDNSESKNELQKNEWKEHTTKRKISIYIALLIVFVSLFIPAVLYVKEVGIEDWQQYQYWITMGNALSGVYSMITTFLVFLFLFTRTTKAG